MHKPIARMGNKFRSPRKPIGSPNGILASSISPINHAIMVNMVVFRYIISPPSFLLPKTFYCKFRIAQYCWFCKAFAYWETIFAGRDDLGTLFLTFCTGLRRLAEGSPPYGVCSGIAEYRPGEISAEA